MMKQDEDYEGLESAVIADGGTITDEMAIIRQFLTALLSIRGREENFDAFMAEAEQDPFLLRLRLLAPGGAIKWGDSNVETLISKLMEEP